MLVVGCWLLDVGCWMLVVGCWLLDVGCSLSPRERVRVRGNDGSTATGCLLSKGLFSTLAVARRPAQTFSSSSLHTRNASVAPQACASQPRCVCGASPSMISGRW